MMEQTNTGKGHRDIVFVTGINHIIVTDRTAGLSDILNAGPVSPLCIEFYFLTFTFLNTTALRAGI